MTEKKTRTVISGLVVLFKKGTFKTEAIAKWRLELLLHYII